MAKVTVKLFGVLRMDTRLSKEDLEAETVEELFSMLNEKADTLYKEQRASKEQAGQPKPTPPPAVSFHDAIVYMNGDRVKKKTCKLLEGAEIWLMSPASGG